MTSLLPRCCSAWCRPFLNIFLRCGWGAGGCDVASLWSQRVWSAAEFVKDFKGSINNSRESKANIASVISKRFVHPSSLYIRVRAQTLGFEWKGEKSNRIQSVDRISIQDRLTPEWNCSKHKRQERRVATSPSWPRPNVSDNEITRLDSRIDSIIMWETRRNDGRRGRTFFWSDSGLFLEKRGKKSHISSTLSFPVEFLKICFLLTSIYE